MYKKMSWGSTAAMNPLVNFGSCVTEGKEGLLFFLVKIGGIGWQHKGRARQRYVGEGLMNAHITDGI